MASAATSTMVVDLSGENDNAGAIAAAASIPTASADAPFERSCDNPECSAPKLISLVPKRETPEFITEPVIMNQPTLINGFTTVFQIDGIGARMNDIMYGTSNGAANRPKSVFRIVPNTHAHIVNYVVVDGAGETMRKIKSNEADTMRKLLDSQRLSAEQMLKKLIGKAFKTPSSRQAETKVPPPVASKMPESSPSDPLPTVPPGITITPIPLSGVSTSASNSTPTLTTAKPATSSGMSSTTNAAKTPKSKPTTATTSPASASTPILRSVLPSKPESPAPNTRFGRPNLLKRKKESPVPEAIKKLRPRSPKQKTPMSVGLVPTLIASLPTTKKLPTLPKLPTNPVAATRSTPPTNKVPESHTYAKKAIEIESEALDKPSYIQTKVPLLSKTNTLPTRKLLVAPKTPAPGVTSKVETLFIERADSVPVKPKRLMGPASKMNAMKAIATAKAAVAHVTKAEHSTGIGSKSSVTRIGETVITSTKSDTPKLPITKPCSVAIEKTEIPINIIIKPSEAEKQLIADSLSDPESDLSLVDEESRPDNTLTSQSTSKVNADTPSAPKVTGAPVLRTNIQSIFSLRASAFRTNPGPEEDPLALGEETTPEASDLPVTPKVGGTPITKANPASIVKVNVSKTGGKPSPRSLFLLKAATSKASPESSPKTDLISISTPETSTPPEKQTPKANPTSLPKPNVASVPKQIFLPMKLVSSAPKADMPYKITRSSTPKTSGALREESTTSPSQAKTLRVVLPTLKNAVMATPGRAPHPNLKISSVISGGTAVAAATLGADSKSSGSKPAAGEKSAPDIEKLQEELASLRRTVARLTKKKV